MQIRPVKRADIPQIARLYYETGHRMNALDYSPEQIGAWASGVCPHASWQRRFRRYRVLVAEEYGSVVGFIELAPNGEIDCFYVRHGHQHRGIGATLMAQVEREARCRGNTRLLADVSLTAEPFFRRVGMPEQTRYHFCNNGNRTANASHRARGTGLLVDEHGG